MPSTSRLWNAGATSGATSATTIAVSPGGAVVIGDAIVVDLAFDDASGSNSVSSIVDGLGNTYTPVAAKQRDVPNVQSAQSFYCIVTAAGTPSFTATFSTSCQYRAIIATAYRHPNGLLFDNTAQALASTATPSSGNLSSVGADGVLHGSCFDSGNFTLPVNGAGFTDGVSVGDGASTMAGRSEWKQISAGTQSATFTLAGGTTTETVGIAFKDAPPASIALRGLALQQRLA